MTDIVDLAQEREQELRDAALRRRAAFAAGRVVVAAEARDCLLCGDPIPKERLAASQDALHCVECQRTLEGKR